MADTRPNLLMVMTDQQRADFFAGAGFALDTMPFLESLRPRGIWFDRAYSPNPICMPARISTLTGRFTKAHGMIANWPPPFEPRFGKDMLQVLREAGYELALFGKNHTYAGEADFDVWRPYSHTEGIPRPGREQADRDFDTWMQDLAHWSSSEPTPFPLESQYPVRIVDDALAWLGERPQRPFFAWVSFPEPHSPYQVPEPYFSLFPPEQIPPPAAGPEALAKKNHQWRMQYETIRHYHPDCDRAWRRYRANYCGMLRLIDDQLKRLMSDLEGRGLLQNTIIVYLSDHGEFCGDYGLYRKGLALPQCSIRIPMFWFGRGIASHGGDHPAHISLTDVFPTMCEALGAPIPHGVQGRSLWPILQGQPYSQREFASIYAEHGVGGRVLGPADGLPLGQKADTVYINGVARTNFDGTRIATSGYRRTVIKGRWKLIHDTSLPPELYDLEQDPVELNNLAADNACAAVRAELAEELLHWSVRLDDNLLVSRYDIPMPPHNWHR